MFGSKALFGSKSILSRYTSLYVGKKFIPPLKKIHSTIIPPLRMYEFAQFCHFRPLVFTKQFDSRLHIKKCMRLSRTHLRCITTSHVIRRCITTSHYELRQVLENDKLEKGPLEMLAPELFAVPYKSKSAFVTSHSKYNIVIALYTTAFARITLYRYMEQIIMAPNYKLLYTGNCCCSCYTYINYCIQICSYYCIL